MAVSEPRPVSGDALPSSDAEVAAIASLFEAPVVLRGEGCSREKVLASLVEAEIAHLSCHGATNWVDHLQSGLLMAHDQMLTVQDVFDRHLRGGRLATLSACETGMVGIRLPDEVVALPSAFLRAGFAGVVASLWSVEDASTAMLMERFYSLWRVEGRPPTLALREAQQWLRDTTNREKAAYFWRHDAGLGPVRMPAATAAYFHNNVMMRPLDARDFEHPFYWAAFYLTGV